MNILEAEDMVKGLPDQVLYQYAENPPPQIPQFLAISEVQRRQEMRQRFQASQQQPEQTVKDQILQGGIASAGGPPPMAPEGAAPPGAPMQQPMTGAPMPPMGMAMGGITRMSDGGKTGGGTGVYYGGFTPSILNRPDRLQRAYGASYNQGVIDFVQRDFLGNPVKLPFLQLMKTAIKDPESLITPEAIIASVIQGANPGLRAPPVSGGGGGGLPYGGPTSYGGPGGYGRNELMNMISQFGDRRRPTVTVEELGQPTVTVEEIPQGMAVGGIVPYRMQEGRTVPSFLERSGLPFVSTPEGSAANREALSRFFTPRRAQFSVIREAQALAQAGRLEEATALLRNEGIDPARALSPTPSTAPPMEAAVASAPPRPRLGAEATTSQVLFPGATPPAAPPAAAAAPPIPPGGIANAGAAMANQGANVPPSAGSQSALSLQSLLSGLVSSNERPAEVQAAIDLQRQNMEQGLPPPVDISQFIQSAQQRQKEAKDEARRMAIAGTLMNLGAGVMGGDPAAGLRQATQTAMSTLAEGRREASAEGRMAEQLQLQAAQQQRQSILDTMKFKSEAVNNIANIVSGEQKATRDNKLQAAQIIATYQANRERIIADERVQLGRNANSAQAARSAALKVAGDYIAANPAALIKDDQQLTPEQVSKLTREFAMSLDPEAFGGSSASATLSKADQEALAWANSNPNDPRASQIKARLGVR